jgi:hypothetical protein
MAFVDQLDQTVEKIIDQAIDFYMYTRGWYRVGDGSFYHMTEMGWEITPPGKSARTTGGQVTHDGSPAEWGFDYGTGTNSGSLVYGHFEDTIRDIFSWWRSIPTPADFDKPLDYLRDAAWYISLTSAGNKVDEVGNAELTAVDFLQKKIGGDDMGGNMILAFDQNFCTPLPTVIHGQYAVALLAGTTLCAEKEIWVKTEKDILAIVDKMLEAMKDRGASLVPVVDLSVITALVGIAGVFKTPAKEILNGAGTVLSSLDSLLKQGEPKKPTVEFAADTPEGVITKTQEAMKKLAETIRGREDEIERSIKDALTTVTDPTRSGSFDMPAPALLKETQIDEMKVDLHDLHFLATDTLPKIEKQLNLASDNAFYGSICSDAWYRPVDIGVSDTAYGPYDAWAVLISLAGDLTGDLAWEVKESGTHLEIASDRIGQTEAQVEASMQRHAEKISTGSGRHPLKDANDWLWENP